MQYAGGQRQCYAEFYACVAVWRYCQLTGAEPPRLGYYRVLERHFTIDSPYEPAGG